MDGIFRTDPPRIEEIKTGFNIHELRRRLSGNPLEHPYCLQLLTYGYFYWLEYRVIPELRLHLVSTRTRESLDIALKLDLPVFEAWLDLRLNELLKDAQKAEKRSLRRRKLSVALTFPYETLRQGQDTLMQVIEEGMNEKRPMLLQAPAGLGKTIGVLYPVLKQALGRRFRNSILNVSRCGHITKSNTMRDSIMHMRSPQWQRRSRRQAG